MESVERGVFKSGSVERGVFKSGSVERGVFKSGRKWLQVSTLAAISDVL